MTVLRKKKMLVATDDMPLTVGACIIWHAVSAQDVAL